MSEAQIEKALWILRQEQPMTVDLFAIRLQQHGLVDEKPSEPDTLAILADLVEPFRNRGYNPRTQERPGGGSDIHLDPWKA